MKPFGSYKTHHHIAHHYECSICHPDKKGGRAYETRVANQEIEDQMDNDKDIIMSSTTWPQWPLLPLINRTTKECGFLLDNENNRFRIYKANMWNIPNDLSSVPYDDYDSADAVLNNGWKVD